ncbi:MAG: insulinase family protein, partial [Myxococcales bacterium]
MKVIMEPSAALPLVSMTLAFRAGSAHDPSGKEGLSRATARMLRRGGAGLSPSQIEESVDRLGGSFSADSGFGWTAVGAEVLGRNAEAMAELVSKVIARPDFDENELGKLRREIEAGIVESRDSDATLAARALRREVFPDHAYGRRVGGYVPTVQSLTPDDARDHHSRHFNRANAVVVVSGDVTKKRARALAEQLIEHLPEGKASPDPIPEATARPGRHLVFVDKPDRTQMQMLIGTIGAHPDDEDLTALQVATAVLGGTFSARMMQEVRVQRGWSYGAYARVGLDRHREMFTMQAAPGSSDAAPCAALLVELLEKWRADGVTSDELSFTKKYLRRSHVFDIDTAAKRAQQKLDVELHGLPSDYHSGYTDRVKAVSVRDAAEAIARRVDPQSLVIAVVGSHAESGAAIEKAIPGLTSSTVVPYD